MTRAAGYIDKREANRRVRELSEQYGLEIDPTAEVDDLPVGLQQRVEIIKALYRHADILILDEPTAVLTPQEANELFRIMRELTERGVSIIFITHKLKEVLAVADRIVVLRGGRVAGTADPKTSTEASLAELMVGRKVILQVEKDDAHPTTPVLTIDDMQVRDCLSLIHIWLRGAHRRSELQRGAVRRYPRRPHYHFDDDDRRLAGGHGWRGGDARHQRPLPARFQRRPGL